MWWVDGATRYMDFLSVKLAVLYLAEVEVILVDSQDELWTRVRTHADGCCKASGRY